MAADPITNVQEHVQDTNPAHPVWPIFHDLFGGFSIPLLQIKFGDAYTFTLTKFMLLELIAAGLIIAIFVPIARRAASGAPPTGYWWNMFESLLTFVRNEIAHPTLAGHDEHHEESHGTVGPVSMVQEQLDEAHHGKHPPESAGAHASHAHPLALAKEHPADRYVPFLWTVFLFILFCNLLGMIPFMGSPTASIWVTGALGLIAFAVMHGVAIAKMGPVSYVKSLWPAMEIPFAIAIFLKPMIFVIEVLGTVIKSGVLAVRLFANMFAGHTVLAMILFFIVMAGNAVQGGAMGHGLWGGITIGSVLGVVALSLLELFVAFLQAYVFTFLLALFMGMSLNPSH
jgi:F-type H+-transporting ATPase subunit a